MTNINSSMCFVKVDTRMENIMKNCEHNGNSEQIGNSKQCGNGKQRGQHGQSENSELLGKMEKCGHFLYHRRGGKRGQGRILKILLTEGEKTQKELQDYLEIQSGSMSEIVLKMEESGLISREKDESDRRKIKLKITEQGKMVFEEHKKANHEQEKQLFEGLNTEEQDELKQLLSKLLESWESQYGYAAFGRGKGYHNC